LTWEFDESLHGEVRGVGVYKVTGEQQGTLLERFKGKDKLNPRKYRAYGNAGLTILNVTEEDAGMYENAVVFENQLIIDDNITLIVHG